MKFYIKAAMIVFYLIFIITVFCSCAGNSYTAEDLANARARKASGQKLNREDSIMVEGFEKWKAENDKYADY